MAARIYRDRDVSLAPLSGKTCAVIGYGAQGRAQALNLRDSEIEVVIGLYKGSRSRDVARRDGLKVLSTAAAVAAADVLLLALPDTATAKVYEGDIAPQLHAGQTLLFAHGFAIHYRTIAVPNDINVVMVAPKGLGPMVRRLFVAGKGAPGLVAVHQDASGDAKKIALAWAKGIGCTRAGVIETSFREETETDLFGEQAVLCGGMTALVRAGFETLIEAGYSPELAYYECLHELKFIVDLMHEQGISGMRERISETATWGDLTVGPRIIDSRVKKSMAAALRRIRSGEFARELLHEIEQGRPAYDRLLASARSHPIEKVGRRLRALMESDEASPRENARGEHARDVPSPRRSGGR